MEPPHREPVRAPKIAPVISPQIEEDNKRGNGKNFFSRMFEKKKTDAFERVEEKVPGNLEAPQEPLRISSCGQPRITGTGRVEIPLTLEVTTNGHGKSLSVNLNVAINLEPLRPQG